MGGGGGGPGGVFFFGFFVGLGLSPSMPRLAIRWHSFLSSFPCLTAGSRVGLRLALAALPDPPIPILRYGPWARAAL